MADGSFGLLDLERGAVIHETKATYQGLPTVVQCLSVGAAGLAVGTLCGNICVLPWG
ncbi:MAG: hypothetical protein H6718_04890 [Polyangiaceae bacterium]|nr:hypothetical protein [Polyangiaceae bacterium]